MDSTGSSGICPALLLSPVCKQLHLQYLVLLGRAFGIVHHQIDPNSLEIAQAQFSESK